jgi:hypothetical protein
VRANPEPTTPRTLERLAQLLRDRHDASPGRSFVMLMADLRNRYNTDDLTTQPMPVLRLPDRTLGG